MLLPKQAGTKADYLIGNTESTPGGPYDRGDASRRNGQRRSDSDPKNNVEVVRAGSTLDVPEEHSKLAAKVIRSVSVLILIKLVVFCVIFIH